MYAWQAAIRDISGLGDRSAYGLPDESGVLLLDVPVASPAAKAGLQKDDVILRLQRSTGSDRERIAKVA